MSYCISVALFNQIQSVGIVDGQESSLFGSSPDGITVSTATSIFEDPSTTLQTSSGVRVPAVQFISTDMVTGSTSEIVSENIQPVTPEKVLL